MNEVQSAPSMPKTSELLPKPVIKAGFVFGAASAVLSLLTIIPILGIFFSLLNWVIGVAAGYVVITAVGGSKDKLPDVLKHTVGAGIIMGLVAGVGSAIASVLSRLMITTSLGFGIYYTPGLADYIFMFFGAFVWSVVGMVIWSSVGGLVQVYFTPDKLPAQVKVQLDKVVSFLKK